MKTAATILLLAGAILMISCGQQSEKQTPAGEPVEVSESGLLEKEVLKVHDEVMPKMGNVQQWKSRLKERLATETQLSPEKKQEIELTIQQLDSAYDGMMIWMRNFKPVPDSVSTEKAREYLEDEMEKVKKVKEDILTTLEKAEKI